MKSEELITSIEEKRQDKVKLEEIVSSVVARLASTKNSYQHAVENGEEEDKLDQRDEQIIRGERELTRAQIKLNQCKAEIESLTKERNEALAVEQEQEFLKHFDVLVEDKFVLAEMALADFKARLSDIEQSIRGFMTEAAKAGRDTHRLRITDNLRRQIVERLYPGYLTKSKPEAFAAPLADVLENHVRVALSIPRQPNGKTIMTETEERSAAN